MTLNHVILSVRVSPNEVVPPVRLRQYYVILMIRLTNNLWYQ